jgi:PBP1b-binding outer membrane lipoprotein LpoB
MPTTNRLSRPLSLVLLGAIALTSCSAAPTSKGPTAQAPKTESAAKQPTAPQLIRKADLALDVKESGPIVKKIRTLITAAQGDLVSLEEQDQAGDTRRASLTVRVPQEKLDRTLDDLSALGNVRRRSVSAEDVSTQIVDTDARLRNLKKSETAVLALLDRSGNVTDILKVSQELSRIREQIEQLTAQVTQLKTQVAYSTIAIELTEAVALAPTQRQFGDQLGSAWNSASHSVGGFTRGLVVLAVWLLAYSPYIGAIAGLVYLLRRRRRKLAGKGGCDRSDSNGFLRPVIYEH